jgi:hypothetical protein
MKAVCVALSLLCVVLAVGYSASASPLGLKRKLTARQRWHYVMQSRPRATFAEYDAAGAMDGDDHFSQIKEFVADFPESAARADTDAEEDGDGEDLALVQTGTKKVQSFCEICILVMQMKERGQPHLCAGLNDQYYVTCVEVLISLLRADKALVYWLKNGCMHMDSTGPEIVRPCPAINICSWIPNLFSQPPSIVRDGVESLCPKDNKFLPTIPQEYKSLIPADKE